MKRILSLLLVLCLLSASFAFSWGTTTGTVATVGTDTVVNFSSTGTINFTGCYAVQILVLAGGGGGGWGINAGGGGGAGGLQLLNRTLCGFYNASVGPGGQGGTSNSQAARGKNGTASDLSNSTYNLTAKGGGAGGNGYNDYQLVNGSIGGSGGGGQSIDGAIIGIFGAGTAGQGFGGANGQWDGASEVVAGGGGSSKTNATDRQGADGNTSSINGTSICYGAGGGGGIKSGASGTPGSGGCAHTGGDGNTHGGDGNNAIANTGSGGGGGGAGGAGDAFGGNGSAGIIIIRFNAANTTTMNSTGTGVNPINANLPIGWNASANTSTGTFQGFNWTIYKNGANTTSGNYACNGGSCNNNTAYVIRNDSPSIYSIGDQLIFSAMAYSTNNFANSSYLNSSTYTIVDNVPKITNLLINPNSTTSTITPTSTINGNITVEDNDTAQVLTVNYSWYKNGVNQTALAGGFRVWNGTPNSTSLNLGSVTTVGGDNWSFGAVANDTLNVSKSLNSTNTTITAFNTTTMNSTGTGVNPINANLPIGWNASANTSTGTFQGFNWTIYKNGANTTSGNYACNGGSCNNNTAYVIRNDSPSIYSIGDQLIFSAMAYSTNNFANSSYLNSSTYTIVDNVPFISNLMINPNSSTSTIYANQTIYGNITVLDNDTAQVLTVNYSWYKNGVNQTALAGGFRVWNGTANWTGLDLSVYGSAGDSWIFGAQVNETLNWTKPLNSTATVITDLISNLTMSSPTPEYDLYAYSHGLNLTLAAGITINTISAGYGGSTFAASLTSSSGGAQQWNASIQPPFSSITNSYNILWTINGNYANGSSFIQTNTSNSFIVEASGLYANNSTIVQPSLNYSFYDINSSASINATLTANFNITSSNGSIKTFTFSGTNNTINAYIYPSGASFAVSSTEVANASGYITTSTGRSTTASSTVRNISIFLLPNALAEATILTVNQFPNIPINGAYITIEQYIAPSNYTLFKTCTTGADGTCLVYLTPNIVYYRYNVSALSSITSFGPEILTCSPTAPNCFRTFVLNAAALPYQDVGNFSGSCAFNYSNNILNCSAVDLGTTITMWNVSATYINGSQVCLNSTGGSTATLTCYFDNSTANTIPFSFSGYDANGNQYLISNGIIIFPGVAQTSFGRSGWLALLLLFGVIAMAGFQSPGLSMVLGLLALVFGGIIGLVPIISIQSAVIAAAIMAGILMWKMRV